MKCSNCGTENNSDSLFCISCGNKLNNEVNSGNNFTNENNMQNNNVNNNVQPMNNTNNNSTTKPKSKWLTIGLPIAIVLIVIVLIGSLGGGDSSGTSYSPSYQTESGQTKFGNYLVSVGFTKNSNTNYTLYYEGYLYTFDFVDAVLSLENNTMYSAYYYKKDMYGTAMISDDGTTFVATYDFNSYRYNCEVDPPTYQSYICSNLESTIIETAATAKQTFYSFLNSAGVSIYDL